MKIVSSWRTVIGALIVTGGAIAACSSHTKNQQVTPAPLPMGESTAPSLANPSMVAPDAGGVPSPDQPLPEVGPSTSMSATVPTPELRTAEAAPYAGDAGIDLMPSSTSDAGSPGRDGGSGSAPPARDAGAGSGSGSGTKRK